MRFPTALLGVLCLSVGLVFANEFRGCIPQLGLSLTRASSLKAGNWDGTSSMEVLDYDPFSKLAAVVEARRSATSPLALLIVNYANTSTPFIHRRILVSNSSGEGDTIGTPNSVSVWNGYAALTLDGVPYTASGVLRVYHMASGAKVGETVLFGCAMPDSVKWSSDGRRMVIACEGEPATQEVPGSDPNVEPNPSGAVAIVTVRLAAYTAAGASLPNASFGFSIKLLGFQAFIDSLPNRRYLQLLNEGLRIDPRLTKATAAKDIEPEYVALHSDPAVYRAFVTLQENNAVALIDFTPGQERIRAIWPLGLKNWTVFPLDPSDVDGVRLRSYPGLVSWYQPDTIVFATIGRGSYLFIANEGDSKAESRRVKELSALDPATFGNVRLDTELGRLSVDSLFGVVGGYNVSKAWNEQGPYNRLYAYGGRSWSILDAKTGKLVFESGAQLETVLASHPAARACFNCDRDRNDVDSRSDNSGPEPEAIEVFKMGDRTFVAVGLERMGGMMLYDVSNPTAPVFGAYVYNRNFTASKDTPTALLGDLAPEGIHFVAAEGSSDGNALLLLSNEVSATASAWRVQSC